MWCIGLVFELWRGRMSSINMWKMKWAETFAGCFLYISLDSYKAWMHLQTFYLNWYWYIPKLILIYTKIDIDIYQNWYWYIPKFILIYTKIYIDINYTKMYIDIYQNWYWYIPKLILIYTKIDIDIYQNWYWYIPKLISVKRSSIPCWKMFIWLYTQALVECTDQHIYNEILKGKEEDTFLIG